MTHLRALGRILDLQVSLKLSRQPERHVTTVSHVSAFALVSWLMVQYLVRSQSAQLFWDKFSCCSCNVDIRTCLKMIDRAQSCSSSTKLEFERLSKRATFGGRTKMECTTQLDSVRLKLASKARIMMKVKKQGKIKMINITPCAVLAIHQRVAWGARECFS
ncbi:hypothetical protein F4604DRAFT_833003 [Suillus subluteus]|nr:hypothetical protein F4604DRAFT_833003 [Suillus subluteus]